MADSRLGREVVVGTIVLVVMAIFVVGTFFLSGTSLFPPEGVKILFKDAGDLKRASPVRVSGVPVGKVVDIKLLEPGKVEVTISLPEEIVLVDLHEARHALEEVVGVHAADDLLEHICSRFCIGK